MSAEGQEPSPLTCRQETKKTDPDESARQGVKQEPAKELVGRKGHRARGVITLPVLPSERDLAVVKTDEAMVGDGDPMGVAGQVVENMLRPAEGTLRVDDPVDVVEGADEGPESLRVIERFQITPEAQLSPFEGPAESVQELPPEDSAEHVDRKEEPMARPNPPGVIRRQTAGRNHTMDVRVVSEGLSPGMQNTEDSDLSPKMFPVTGNLEQGGRTGLKQEAIDHPLVLPRKTGDGLRYGEHDMHVRGGQQFTGTFGHPAVPRSGLTLRAVTIPA